MKLKVLYAGDSKIGGSANYLYGALKKGGLLVTHLPPDQPMSPGMLRERHFDSIILSDYPKNRCSEAAQRQILDEVRKGSGFMMVGGWASFSGPFGGWRGTLIEGLLPVQCLEKDDRTNFFGGAAVQMADSHPSLNAKIFKNPPMICGLNRVKIKRGGKLLLSAKPMKISQAHGKIKAGLKDQSFPLLVVDKNPQKRVAAFMTDAAPHWCGGLVDWGKKILKVPVTPEIEIQVGENYCGFFSGLVRWLCGN